MQKQVNIIINNCYHLVKNEPRIMAKLIDIAAEYDMNTKGIIDQLVIMHFRPEEERWLIQIGAIKRTDSNKIMIPAGSFIATRLIEINNPFIGSEEEFEELWLEWIQERKERKYKAYTSRGQDAQILNLFKLSNGDIDVARAIVHQSMAQGYQGLFAVKSLTTQKQKLLKYMQ